MAPTELEPAPPTGADGVCAVCVLRPEAPALPAAAAARISLSERFVAWRPPFNFCVLLPLMKQSKIKSSIIVGTTAARLMATTTKSSLD